MSDKDQRYQYQPWHIKAYRWFRWMPYACLRGMYWYIFHNDLLGDGHESLDFCMSLSIGTVQAEKMRWVCTFKESCEMWAE